VLFYFICDLFIVVILRSCSFRWWLYFLFLVVFAWLFVLV